MRKYNDPLFNVVVTSNEDILTLSSTDATVVPGNAPTDGFENPGGAIDIPNG